MGQSNNKGKKKHMVGAIPFNSHSLGISEDQVGFIHETIEAGDNRDLRDLFPVQRPLYWPDRDVQTEADIEHFFVFLHHSPYIDNSPPWIENYRGNNWFSEIHPKLLGPSSMVFSGDAPFDFPSANFTLDGVSYRTAWLSSDGGAFLLVRVMKDGVVSVEAVTVENSSN